MAEPVVQQFVADDAQYIRALEKQIAAQMRKQQADEKAAKTSRQASDEEIRGIKAQEAALDAVIRKWQAFKLARDNATKAASGQMIVAPDWVHATRGGGPMGPYRGTNFTFGSPPSAARLTGPGGFFDRPPEIAGYLTGPVLQESGWQRVGRSIREAMTSGAGYLRDFDAAMSSQMGRLAQMAGGWLSIQTVIQATRGEMQRVAQFQSESLNAQKSVASGQANIFLNTFDWSDDDQKKLLEAHGRISAQTGVMPGIMGNVLGPQAGRGMNLTADQVIQASEWAARLGRHNQNQIEPMAGGIQQIMRVGGVDARTAAALMMSGAAKTYIGDPTLQARFLTQAMSGGAANVPGANFETLRQIMGMGAWISQEVGEERGEAARTSVVAGLAEMDQFARGTGPWARQMSFGGISRTFHRPVKGFPNQPEDRIRWFEEHPAELRRFMDRFSERRLFEGTYERAFEKGSPQNVRLHQMIGSVQPDTAMLDRLARNLVTGTPQISTANSEQLDSAQVELAKAGMTREGVTANLRQRRDEAFSAAWHVRRFDPVTSRIMTGLNDFGGYLRGDQAEVFLGQMEGLRGEILQGRPSKGRWSATTPNKLDADERRVYALLTDLINNGRQQLRQLEQLNKQPKAPSSGPAANAEISYGRSGSW